VGDRGAKATGGKNKKGWGGNLIFPDNWAHELGNPIKAEKGKGPPTKKGSP